MEHLSQGQWPISGERLKGIRRGIEKESLRATASGMLADTPHPAALGSALTHPHITTDFSESPGGTDYRRTCLCPRLHP